MTRGLPARISRRGDFLALKRSRLTGRGNLVRVTCSRAGSGLGSGEPRVAFAIGKKVGGAVERNRIRRRLRVVCAELSGEFLPGDYLIGVSAGVDELSHGELRQDVRNALIDMLASIKKSNK